MSGSANASKKNVYDPVRSGEWGAKPGSRARGAAYVVSGHVVSSSDMQQICIDSRLVPCYCSRETLVTDKSYYHNQTVYNEEHKQMRSCRCKHMSGERTVHALS